MALDIVLSVNGKAPEWREETSVSFNADADYWYLWPTMIRDIKNQTGKLLDLYDDAKFSGQELISLEQVLEKQLVDLASEKPKEWDVHVGTQTHPIKKDIYKKLVKKDLQLKLEKFLFIVRLAKEEFETVICIGD
jgi:hypothetical protein